MGLFELFGIHGAVAPMSSFIELVKSLRGNRVEEKEQFGKDVVIDDNQEKEQTGEK